MNIKVYVQGIFGNKYTKHKNLVKRESGDIFRRQPSDYNDVFDFDTQMNDGKREERLKNLFGEFIVPFTNKALSREGLKYLEVEEEISLLPAVKKELENW